MREHHRIGRFEDLGRRDGRGRDRVVAVVEAVALGIAAKPAAEEGEHHPARAVVAMAGERQRVDRADRAQPLRALGAACARAPKIDVDHPQDRLGVARRPAWARLDAEQGRGRG